MRLDTKQSVGASVKVRHLSVAYVTKHTALLVLQSVLWGKMSRPIVAYGNAHLPLRSKPISSKIAEGLAGLQLQCGSVGEHVNAYYCSKCILLLKAEDGLTLPLWVSMLCE